MPGESCPDCTGGTWESDGRLCPTCEGERILTIGRAVMLLLESRQKTKSLRHKYEHSNAEKGRLRRLVEEELGPHSTHRELAAVARKQADTIKVMADTILRLKVEAAELGGRPLEQTVPNAKSRDRALRLVHDGAA